MFFTCLLLLSHLFHQIQPTKLPTRDEIKSLLPMAEHPDFDQIYSILEGRERSEAPRGIEPARIYSGMKAKMGEFPHLVGVVMVRDIGLYLCGGSIISPNFILTAGHCLANSASGFIYAGILDIMKRPLIYATAFNQSDMIIHENYTYTTHIENDIGVIRLQRPLPCHRSLGSVDLPCDCDMLADVESEQLTIAGFGKTHDSVVDSFDLNYASFDGALSNCECDALTNVPIYESMMCVGVKGGVTTCAGDSGSPVTANIHGRTVVVGLVSFGTARVCSLKTFTGLTRVSSYREWIREKTGL